MQMSKTVAPSSAASITEHAANPPQILNHGIHRIHGKIGEPCRGGDVENW